MKRSITLLAAVISLVALPALAESDIKVGVISTERVMRDSDPAKKAMKKLEKEFEKRSQELERSRQQLQKIQEDMEKNAVTLSEGQRKAKEKEFADLSREFQRKQREFNEDVNARRNEELQAIVERANRAIRALAEKEGFDLIVQEAVYASPRIDVTDKVIKALSESAVPAK